jgi:cytochrome c-type protein NapC
LLPPAASDASCEPKDTMVPGPTAILFILLGTTMALLIILLRPGPLTTTTAGKILAFLAFCGLPVLCGFWGLSEHLERSKETSFCLSCHIMQPYGRSLYAEDPSYIPAAHFQNHRIAADEACYTCHTDYAMYGTIKVKLHGLRHIYVQYFGTPMNPIRLYEPYNNRECLHCHAGARSFENATHMALLDQIKANELSCVSSGCHDTIHNAASIDKVKSWRPQE